MANAQTGSWNTDPQETRFFDKLVVLRGLGAFGILAFHFFGDVFHRDEFAWKGWFLDPTSGPNLIFTLAYPLTYGWAAIFLFFVISGFVNHNSFLQSDDFKTGHFLWRRLWRLYPTYLAVVGFFCVVLGIRFSTSDGARQIVSHLLLAQNFHWSTFHGIVPTLWYVATEFQLYLLFPALLWLRRRFGMQGALWFTLGLSLATRVATLALVNLDDSDPKLAYWLFPTAVWFDWTLGAYVAECFHDRRRAFTVSGPQLTGLIVLFLAMTCYLPAKVFSTQLASFVFAVLMEKYLWRDRPLNGIEKAILPVGWCSYSMYLWHEPVSRKLFGWLHSWGFPPRDSFEITLGLAIVFAGNLAVSLASYYALERGGAWLGRVLWRMRESNRPSGPDFNPSGTREERRPVLSREPSVARPAHR